VGFAAFSAHLHTLFIVLTSSQGLGRIVWFLAQP